MIIRSIQVRNWRCFVGSVSVDPFSEALNVLHAPNATGKSTLFEALCRGLLDGHKVTGREIEAIRPWGRLLAPAVTVEFSHQSVTYRIAKQFIEGASAVLERLENGRFVRLAEGNSADEMVREILTRNPPGRGLARPENWGIAQILWAPQGNLALENLSGDVVADIRHLLGIQVSGPKGGPIEKRIEQAYLQRFTPSGRLRTGKDAPRLSKLEENLEDAVERRAQALSQQQAYEEAVRRVEDLHAQRLQAKRNLEAITKPLIEARSRADSYKGLLSESRQREERLKATEAEHRELKQRIGSIKDIREDLKKARETIYRVEQDMPLVERELDSREKNVFVAKATLEDARKGRQAVDDTQEIAVEARRFLEGKRTLADLTNTVERIKQAQQALASCKKERSALVAPDESLLRDLRRAIKKRDDAQIRIDSSLITVEIVPEAKGSLTVITGERTGVVPFEAEKPLLVKGSPEVVLDFPEIGRFRAWGPTGSVEEERAARDHAERKIRDFTDPFGTSDLDELEMLRKQANELDRKVSEAETHLETVLSGQLLEEIERECSKVAASLVHVSERHADWDERPPDLSALEAEAEEKKRSFVDVVEKAESNWEAAQSALISVKTKKATLAATLEQAQSHRKSLESKLSDLTSDGKKDEEREEALRNATLSWEGARLSLEEVEKKLSSFVEDPIATVDKLEKQLDAAKDLADKALEEEKSAEGMLEQLSAQGTYSSVALVEEEVARIQHEIAAEQLRVDAIRLLYDTLSQSRKEAFDAVVGPVEAIARRNFHRIAGTKLGGLDLDESFKPVHVVPEISDSSVSLDNVSGGEREQIFLATRLALAEVLAEKERQLVVLDDVLTFTDTGRLARVMSILEEAAQQLQVLILTCHPERYLGLEGAHFIDLEAVLR
jgi:hypothetical protein